MKITDGLKLEGRPAEIPDCSRDDLPKFFVEMGYKVGAEIGVKKGEFSAQLCRTGLNIYAIDPWKSYTDYAGDDERNNLLYEHTKRLLSPYPNSKIIRKASMDAVVDFSDESLDFVYIDANHQLKYITEDLVEWSKKVKKGGVISGHDYIYTKPTTQAAICHVIYAVNAFTAAYKIKNWYLLGRRERRENEIRDRFRSWMFVKPK